MTTNVKVNILKGTGSTKAFASVEYDGLIINDLSIVARKDGTGVFVSFPERKTKDGKYFPIFRDAKGVYDKNTKTYTPGPVESEIRQAVLAEYTRAVQEAAQTPASPEPPVAQAPASAPAPAAASAPASGDGLFDWV